MGALGLVGLAGVSEAFADVPHATPSIDLRGWNGAAGVTGGADTAHGDAHELAKKLAEIRRVKEIQNQQIQERAMMAELQAASQGIVVAKAPVTSVVIAREVTREVTKDTVSQGAESQLAQASVVQQPHLMAQPTPGDFIKFREVLIDPSEPSKGTVWVAERDAQGNPVLDSGAYQKALSDYEIAQRARHEVAPTRAADELRKIQQEETDRVLASVGTSDAPADSAPKLRKMEQELETLQHQLKRE